MSRSLKRMVVGGCLGVFLAGLWLVPGSSQGQPPTLKGRSSTGDGAAKESTDAGTGEPVVIHREPIQLTEPDAYEVSLQLEAVRSVTVRPTRDGIVRKVQVEPGAEVAAQTELVRLDNTEESLELDRAKARHRVAEIELRRAQDQNDSDLVELAQARFDVARIGLELARHRHDKTSLRAPFAGRVYRIHVADGQLVRAGDPLLQYADPSRLQVEIPIERSQTSEGDTVELQIEDRTVQATVEHVLPPANRFQALRELYNSVASAIVVIDNSQNDFYVGQAVHPLLVPRHPVSQVPAKALANLPDNPEGDRRKVQVLRDGVVRDVPVRPLAQVGTDRIFVSGPFAEGDEVIRDASKELADGTRVEPRTVASTATSGDEAASQESESGSSGNVGF